MSQFLNWFRPESQTSGRRARRSRTTRIRLEQLEDRTLLSFSPATNFDIGPSPAGLALGVFNHGGNLDIVAVNHSTNSVNILLGDGRGSFQPRRAFATGTHPNALAVGDFNGDGNLDIATANGDGTVSILLGNGNGTFQPHQDVFVGGDFRGLAAADLHHSNLPDLVVTDVLSNTITVLLNDGNGGFQPTGTYNVGANPQAVVAADFNGDGNLDLAVANTDDNTVSILLGNGDGTFQPAQPISVGAGPSGLAVGDLNGDGQTDLVVTNALDNTVSVLLGYGDGSFQDPLSFPVGNLPGPVVVSDFNLDGVPDVAVANRLDNTVSVFHGTGDGNLLQFDQLCNVGANPVGLAAGDINGDGADDLVSANAGSNNISLLLNQDVPPPVQLTLAAPHTASAGTAFRVTVSALTSSGTPANGYRGTVHFSCSDPSVPLPDHTFTAADHGTYPFDMTLYTAGPQTLTANDPGNPSLGNPSATIIVSPGPAANLEISGMPSSVTAGQAVTLIATPRDRWHNIATSYRGTVRFSSSDGMATVPGPHPFDANDAANGFPFSVTLRTATYGRQATVTVTDTAGSVPPGSASTVVNPDVTSNLDLSIASTLTAGVAVTAIVTAKDRVGNVTPAYTGMVHFTSSDARAHLPLDYRFTSGTGSDNGSHTFVNGVTLFTAAPNQTITVADTVNTFIRGSATVTVIPNVATHLVLPDFDTVLGLDVRVTETVTAKDAYENVVRSYGDTVHFACTAQAVLPPNYPFASGDNGTHLFSFTPATDNPGNQSFTVSDLTNPNVTPVTVNFSVVDIHGVATHFEFTRILLNYIADRGALEYSVPFGLIAYDAFGDRAVGYQGTVHFTSSNPTNELPGDYTFRSTDQGMRDNFSVLTVRPGSGHANHISYQALSVADVTNPFVRGHSFSFGVHFDESLP